MKKILTVSLLTLMVSISMASARTQYDSTGRHIIYDDTIRGQKRAIQEQMVQQRKLQAAAAAKIDYEEALKSLEEEKPETNYTKYKQRHNIK